MENLAWNINPLTVYTMHFSWLVADEMEWFRVLLLYLSADVSEKPSHSIYGVCQEQSLELEWYNYFFKIFSGSCVYNIQRKCIQNTHMNFTKKLELGVRDY